MLLAPDCNVSFIPSVDGGGRGVAMVTAVAARLAAHRRLLEETLAPFRLTREQLAEVQAQMREAMAKGLQGEASSLRHPPPRNSGERPREVFPFGGNLWGSCKTGFLHLHLRLPEL